LDQHYRGVRMVSLMPQNVSSDPNSHCKRSEMLLLLHKAVVLLHPAPSPRRLCVAPAPVRAAFPAATPPSRVCLSFFQGCSGRCPAPRRSLWRKPAAESCAPRLTPLSTCHSRCVPAQPGQRHCCVGCRASAACPISPHAAVQHRLHAPMSPAAHMPKCPAPAAWLAPIQAACLAPIPALHRPLNQRLRLRCRPPPQGG
jgi:hypothetical protein